MIIHYLLYNVVKNKGFLSAIYCYDLEENFIFVINHMRKLMLKLKLSNNNNLADVANVFFKYFSIIYSRGSKKLSELLPQ